MTRSSLFTTALAVLTTLPILPADEPPKREAKTLGEHTGTVRVLYAPDGTLATFSTPDGKTLATADGKTICLWDTAKGAARTAEGLPAGAERLAFSPDGKTLACVVGRGEIRLWDIATGKVTRSFSADHPKDVPVITLSIAFAPDGKTLAVAYTDGHPGPSYLRLWDPQTGKLLKTLLDGVKFDLWAAVFSPDGTLLAAGDMNGLVRVFRTEDWEKVAAWETGDQLRSMAFAPDSKTLAVGLRRDVQLWDALGKKPLRTLAGHTNWVGSVSFAPDGKTLASGSSDKTARLWPLE